MKLFTSWMFLLSILHVCTKDYIKDCTNQVWLLCFGGISETYPTNFVKRYIFSLIVVLSIS